MSLLEIIDPAYFKAKLDSIDTDLDKLDVSLSTRASESTLSSILGKLDVSLSTRLSEATFTGRFPSAVALGDTLGNPTTTIVGGALLGWDSGGAVWERIYTDGSNRLKVQLDSIPNPPNLDTALSTRASESTLSSILGKLDVSLSTRLADAKIPNALGQASLDVVGSTMYALGMIPSFLPSRMPYCVAGISVGTTESSTAIAAPGGKLLVLKNKGDTDILIGINGSVPATNPLILRARTIRIFPFTGVTAVYYKVAAGSSTLDIEYWN